MKEVEIETIEKSIEEIKERISRFDNTNGLGREIKKQCSLFTVEPVTSDEYEKNKKDLDFAVRNLHAGENRVYPMHAEGDTEDIRAIIKSKIKMFGIVLNPQSLSGAKNECSDKNDEFITEIGDAIYEGRCPVCWTDIAEMSKEQFEKFLSACNEADASHDEALQIEQKVRDLGRLLRSLRSTIWEQKIK